VRACAARRGGACPWGGRAGRLRQGALRAVRPPAAQVIPGLYYEPLTVSGFGDLALTPDSGVALSATYNRQRTNDWSWVTWSYADGTTLYQDPKEDVVFVGVRYHRTWP